MTSLPDYTQAVLAASSKRRPVPLVEADLTPEQRVVISTGRLMSMSAEDCELLVCGELVPWREGGR